ncbi:hypothetical protein [Magnetovibrio sp.]|uniref:hypothetical protein n=1 Tax=Magnetovibrio sp. TaxID=2024836 RepID=UPI002F923D67
MKHTGQKNNQDKSSTTKPRDTLSCTLAKLPPLHNGVRGIAVASVAIVFLGGCSIVRGNTNFLQETAELNKCVELAGDLDGDGNSGSDDFKVIAKKAGEGLDVMLNCYLGPQKQEAPTNAGADALPTRSQYEGTLTISDEHKELRLLRGHIIVTLLSRYGAFNHTGEIGDVVNLNFARSGGVAQSAADTLAAIGDAEYELRRASMHFKTNNDPKSGELIPLTEISEKMSNVREAYDWVHQVRRVSLVTEVLKETSTPTAKGLSLFASRVRTLVQTPTLSGVKELYTQTKTAMKKLALLDRFGKAYLDDARTYIQATYDKGKVDSTDWQFWDQLLEDACVRLQKESGSKRDCTPGNYK